MEQKWLNLMVVLKEVCSLTLAAVSSIPEPDSSMEFAWKKGSTGQDLEVSWNKQRKISEYSKSTSWEILLKMQQNFMTDVKPSRYLYTSPS